MALARVDCVHVWVDDCINLLPFTIDKLVSGRQIPFFEVVFGRAVACEEMVEDSLLVLGVESLLGFFSLLSLQDALLGEFFRLERGN